MYLYGEVHLAECHILHNQRIHARGYELVGKSLGITQLALKEQGVERSVQTRTIAVSILGSACDIIDGVTRSLTRTKAHATHIYGVCSVVNRGHRRRQVLRRRK